MTKTELVMRNYTQKIALAKLALFIGAQIANGQDYEDLRYTYRRADQIQALFDTNIVKIEYDEDMMHDCVATLHHLLGRWLPKGELGIVDSINVPVGTLTAPPAVAHEVYYGWADTGAELTVEQIEGSSFLLSFPGTNYSLPFQEETEYKYLWFAEPKTEPIKTDWEDPTNPLNKGQIGGGGNLFKSPVEIGDYRFYISNYATIADASLTFKSGGEIINPDPEWITPSAPQVIGDDVLNTLTATHAQYPTEIVVSENGGTFEPYIETIEVGDVDRAVGYWKFKVKAGAFRYESAVVDSPAFIKEPVIIEKHTLTVNLTDQTGYTVWVNGSAIVGNTVELDAGTTVSVAVIKAGFDITPASQSVTMDSDKTLTFAASPVVTYRTLTIAVNGLSEPYNIWIDGVQQPSNTLQFVDGTILDDIKVEVEGYTIEPAEIDGVVMDQNRTIVFTAEPLQYTLTIDVPGVTDYDVYIDGALLIGGLVFSHGTVLPNVSLHKVGYTFSPSEQSVTMDQDRTISFTATAIPQYTLTINVTGDYNTPTISIGGSVKIGNTFTYYEGTELTNIVVSEGGYSFSPTSVASLVMNENKTLEFIGSIVPTYTLDINVTGTTGYDVYIDGVVQSAPFVFNAGTVLTSIRPEKEGFVFDPVVSGPITMNSNQTLNFVAQEAASQVISIHNIAMTGQIHGPVEHSFFKDYTIPNGATNITLEFGNYFSEYGGDNGGFGDITIKASIRYNGVYYPVYFNGSRQKYLAMGELVISDIVTGLTLPDNADITVISYVVAPTYVPGTTSGTGVAEGDLTDGGSGSMSYGTLYAPIFIHGVPTSKRTPVVVIFGDSNMDHNSWLTKALSENDIPYMNFGFGGESGQMLTNFGNYPKRFHYVDSGYFTHSVVAHAANDIYNTKNVATITGYLETIYTRVKQSIPVVYCATATPHTNSTDGWATAANQTPFGNGYETARVEFNNIARAGDLLDGCIDVCQEIEANTSNVLTTNGGRYFIGPVAPPSTDGNHLTDAYAAWAGQQLADELPPYFNLLTTPESPTWVADDEANTLSATHPLGTSEILVSENDGAYTAYAGEISVGDVDRPVGYWKSKTKATSERNESLVALSPEFTAAPAVPRSLTVNVTGPSNFTVFVDGVAVSGNIITVEENTTINNITVEAEGWVFSPTSVASILMDSDKSISFTGTVVPEAPVLAVDDDLDILSASHSVYPSKIVVSENDGSYQAYTEAIEVGNVDRGIGYWKFKIAADTGHTESAVVESPAFTFDPNKITLLPDFEALSLPTSDFTETSSGVFQANGSKGDTLWFSHSGNYAFSMKMTGNFINGGVFFSADNGSTTWAGIYAGSGNIQISRLGASNQVLSPQPTIGSYLVLRKVGGVITLESTQDGVTFTLLHTYNEANRSAYNNITYMVGSSSHIITLPQGMDYITLDNVVLSEDDGLDTITATHPDPEADIYVSENDGAYVLYTGPISVGNTSRAAGYWKFQARKGDYISEIAESSAFTPSAGVYDLVFTEFTNATYDAGTKVYDPIDLSAQGSIRKSGYTLPVNTSAAIYMPSTARGMFVGFNVNEDHVYAANQPIMMRIDGFNNNLYYHSYISGTRTGNMIKSMASITSDLRLICRQEAGNRIWKIEESTDNWTSYTVLFTFDSNILNTGVLYPTASFIGDSNPCQIENPRLEINPTQNID